MHLVKAWLLGDNRNEIFGWWGKRNERSKQEEEKSRRNFRWCKFFLFLVEADGYLAA
jgi:hypothetical protein